MQSSSSSDTTTRARKPTRSLITQQIELQSTNLGKRISSTAGDLRRIADDLRTSDTVAGGADLATRGADAMERMGTYLQNADGETLIADAEEFARRQPWAVATAAVVTGFAASRVLKASSSRRYLDRYGN